MFASSSLLNTFPGQLAFTYSSTGNTFTLGNISVVGAAAVTPANQAALDTAVNNQGNIPIIIDADEALGTAAGNASNVSTSATPVIALGAGNTQLTLENLAYNNRLKNDANVELNGATGSLLPLAVAGGNIVDSTGTILLPVASINGIATSNYATYQGLAGVNGTVLDPDFACTAGITAVINVIQGNPAVFNTPQATALLPNLIAVQTNLNNIVSASTAAEAGLVTALNAAILTEGNDTVTGVGFLPELAISNWNATFTINDANNGADNGVILRGSYAETLDCTGYTAVKLTAASSGFLIGEYRIEPSTTVINKSNTGAFIGSEN